MNDIMPEKYHSLPLIGDDAPKFSAKTTDGIINFPDDFAGRWVVLFSHPMDFTPVCTTEFISFQSLLGDFQKLNTDIIGLSVGAIFSHLAWFRSIYNEVEFKDLKNIAITFPVIADIDLKISKLYGMIHPNSSDTATVRAVFIIDPRGKIRTILYYPQNVGRNIKEILRILVALQTSDVFSVSTPADWMPGAPVIKPAPQTTKDMQKRIAANANHNNAKSWYLTFQELPESSIYEKITKNKKRH